VSIIPVRVRGFKEETGLFCHLVNLLEAGNAEVVTETVSVRLTASTARGRLRLKEGRAFLVFLVCKEAVYSV
jgi:hypothetical protein